MHTCFIIVHVEYMVPMVVSLQCLQHLIISWSQSQLVPFRVIHQVLLTKYLLENSCTNLSTTSWFMG